MIAGPDAQKMSKNQGFTWLLLIIIKLARNLQELMSRELYDIEILFKLKQGQDWQQLIEQLNCVSGVLNQVPFFVFGHPEQFQNFDHEMMGSVMGS